MRPGRAVTVAVDLLGGDRSAASVAAGAVAALRADPDVAAILVGPRGAGAAALSSLAGEPATADRLGFVEASDAIGIADEPVHSVRTRPGATVRVAADLVRDGAADAMVSVGSTGATMAAAVFGLGRLPGIARPALAAVVPALRGPLVLLDVGATADTTAETLAHHAVLGAAYAKLRLDCARPRVGLLTMGAEVGKGDLLRKAAHTRIAAALGGERVGTFVGNVEGGDVPVGGVADVIVIDGFTGNVLLKGLEGALGLFNCLLADGSGQAASAAFATATEHLLPERCGGAMLLGVNGVVTAGHGSSSPEAVRSCIGQAVDAVRSGLVPALREAVATPASSAGTITVDALAEVRR